MHNYLRNISVVAFVLSNVTLDKLVDNFIQLEVNHIFLCRVGVSLQRKVLSNKMLGKKVEQKSYKINFRASYKQAFNANCIKHLAKRRPDKL